MSRSLEVLGWSEVLAFTAACCRTLAGARAALHLPLLTDASMVRATYGAVGELWALEKGGLRCPVGAVSDIGGAVERAGRGLTLEPEDLRSVGSGLEGLGQVRKWAESVADEAPAVMLLAHPITENPELAALLRRSFDTAGQLSGAEYPVLDELRRRKESLRHRIQSTLDELLRDDGLGAALQDRYVTERNGRFVLPVKSSFRKGIGIVHGLSQSGETAYIEPAAVVELHNDLTEAESALYREERKILGELSDRVGRGRAPILTSLAAALALDLVCARVSFGHRLGGALPTVDAEGVCVIRDGRHPLLAIAALESGNDVVGNDLALTPERPGLVLTGPNAGGKTVALKTLGLFALMVRAGLPLTAASARVDVFDPIIADIGDQQSVSEGLSTFSAHVKSLTRAMAQARPGALVLIDEITAGTDPTQGAALARAVVETLVDAGARVAVTTHFPEMKALAAEDPRFAVAAAQFAEGRPTFRMETGVPGPSFALAIARRMGVPEAVLDRAEAVMEAGARALTRQLEALDQERARARALTERLAFTEARLAEREADMVAREATLTRRIVRAVDEERATARLRFAEQEAAVRQRVAELQQGNMRDANEALRLIREGISGIAGTVDPQRAQDVTPPEVRVGDRVRHRTLGVVEVIEVKGDKLRISLKGMASWVKPADVLETNRAERRAAAPKISVPTPTEDPGIYVAVAHNTLDLRGFRVEDAFPAIEQFLDANRGRTAVVFVLHGHGTGALKQGVRQWLGTTRWAGRYRPANVEEGGDALTVIQV